jgi:hypothetical protein
MKGDAVMAAVVTKLAEAKAMRCKTRRLEKTVSDLKKMAHRADRRECRQVLHIEGEDADYASRPRLTGWDIV